MDFLLFLKCLCIVPLDKRKFFRYCSLFSESRSPRIHATEEEGPKNFFKRQGTVDFLEVKLHMIVNPKHLFQVRHENTFSNSWELIKEYQ